MRAAAAARLALSLLIEPGDPRLRDLLVVHSPIRVLQALLASEPLDGSALPATWCERAGQLERERDQVRNRAAHSGLRWVCPGDSQWPAQLADLDHVEPLQETAGGPLGLWVRGAARLDRLASRSVAVVGARSCSTYGAEIAGEVAADLASADFTVVSGAAYGIDACAHRGALVVDRPTIAVLACGADRVYPEAHAILLDRIVDEGGLVVSEQAPGAAPLRHRFLSRNRIIAALTLGTTVVEAQLRSGSLNTLHWADLLGRTTTAVPGPVTSNRSAGVHAAVRAGKAVLVTSGQDVVEELAALGMAG
ncbi:MAG: DNA-processing protein DprA [Aeromicrobium sp.]|uniref:DNA-processing protein DprA n=1 Tax=Aeromicrobium sp. TaxID=1871063 RepID=UPI003C40AC49